MYFLADPAPDSPHRPSFRTSPAGLVAQVLPAVRSRKKDMQFADSRFNALRIVPSRGPWHMTWGGALSAMEADFPKEELAVRAVEHSEVVREQRSAPRRESTSHTHTASFPSPRTLACTPSV